MNQYKDRKFIKIFFLAAAIILLAKVTFDFDSFTGLFAYIMGLIRPFFLGFIVAYCINIPVSWFEKKLKKLACKSKEPQVSGAKAAKAEQAAKVKKIKVGKEEIPEEVSNRLLYKMARPISMLVTLSLLVGFIAFGLMSIIPMIYANVRQLVEEVPGYVESGIEAANNLPFVDELGLDEMLEDLSVEDFLAIFSEVNFTSVTQIAGSLFSGIFTAFLTIIATLYFLAEYNNVKKFIKRLIRAHSPRRQKPVVKYIRLVDFSFRKFISCQFLDSLVLATITMVAFTIMGSEYAVTLALMLGVLNVIPYFGSIVGSAVAVFIIWATSGLNMAIIAAISMMVIQQIDGNFINPKIMGASFKISPVLVIIAITVGGAIGGVLGMIFAIPVANVLKTILSEYIEVKEDLRAKLGESAEQQIAKENKEAADAKAERNTQ
jgi:predicted PurR-regulated permease PerM